MTTNLFSVWHREQPSFSRLDPGAIAETAAFPVGFMKVATVACVDIEDVFRATNHIDRPWTENPEVVALPVGNRVRSTSVGDVIVASATGEAWVVDAFGMSVLPPTQAELDATVPSDVELDGRLSQTSSHPGAHLNG